MIYARVHDQTAADDYYAAMARIEARLQLAPSAAAEPGPPVTDDQRAELLELATSLAEPELPAGTRLELVSRMRLLLLGSAPPVGMNEAIAVADLRDPPWRVPDAVVASG